MRVTSLQAQIKKLETQEAPSVKPALPTLEDAQKLVRVIETILTENNLHYRIEYVRNPDLAFINFSDISIKVGRRT